MNTVILNWEQTNLNNMILLQDTYLYAFVRGRNLIYLGMSKKQEVANEIIQNINRFNISSQGLSIWLGYFVEDNRYNNTFQRTTKQIIKDVECLLIYSHKPTYNKQCVKNYTGRMNFKIINKSLLHSVEIADNINTVKFI